MTTNDPWPQCNLSQMKSEFLNLRSKKMLKTSSAYLLKLPSAYFKSMSKTEGGDPDQKEEGEDSESALKVSDLHIKTRLKPEVWAKISQSPNSPCTILWYIFVPVQSSYIY